MILSWDWEIHDQRLGIFVVICATSIAAVLLLSDATPVLRKRASVFTS